MLNRFLGWLVRRVLLFVLLLAALVAHQLLAPRLRDFSALEREAVALERVAPTVREAVATGLARADAGLIAAQREGRDALDARIAAADRARKRCSGDLAAAMRGGAAAVLANRRACIAAALTRREIAALRALRNTLDARRPGETLRESVARHTATMRAAAADNARTRAAIAAIDMRALGRLRFRADRAALVARSRDEVARYDAAKRAGDTLLRAEAAIARSRRESVQALTAVEAEFAALTAARRTALERTALAQAKGWAHRVDLWGKAKAAAIALVSIMAMPYLIRILFFFVLAPLAERARTIRLSVGAGPPPIGSASAVSAPIRLGEGEELLVRQDYLQSTARGGDTRTRWLLDWRHPIASIAARLVFLTRIRGAGQVTIVSAVHDPFAEVAVIDLPRGAAIMLHPRALAAVAQPIAQPLRITRHWRLATLNAWLTLQLRYFVFHGPARLVVKGGRGVRIEAAERGRVFAQDQLVGFSADLAYAVTRTETFWPYFFGRESLLKDTVAQGGGVLVIEEAPLAGGGTARVRHGLEGATDALLKVFGI